MKPRYRYNWKTGKWDHLVLGFHWADLSGFASF